MRPDLQQAVRMPRHLGTPDPRVEQTVGGLRGRRQLLLIEDRVGEPGIPPEEVLGQVVVQNSGTYLEQEVRTSGALAHLLFLHHPFAHDLVNR